MAKMMRCLFMVPVMFVVAIGVTRPSIAADEGVEPTREQRVADALVSDILNGNRMLCSDSLGKLASLAADQDTAARALLDVLRKTRTGDRTYVWNWLAPGLMGDRAKLVVPDLCDVLFAGSGPADAAANTLGKVDAQSAIVMPVLHKAAVKGKQSFDLALTLARAGYVDDEGMEVVRHGLLRGHYYQQRAANSKKVGQLREKGKRFLPALLEALLVDGQRGAQESARTALLQICPREKMEDPEIVAVMKGVNAAAFAEALKETTCMPSLLAEVQHIFSFLPGQSDRISALTERLSMGATTKIPSIGVEPTKEELDEVGRHMKLRDGRAAAAKSLGNEIPPAASAVPALTKALSDVSTFVQSEALVALGNIGRPARSAAPAIVKLYESAQDPPVVRKGAYRVGSPHVAGSKLRMDCVLALLKLGERERGSEFLKKTVRTESIDLTKLAGPLRTIGEEDLLRELCRYYWSGTDQWRRYHALMALCNADAVDGEAAAAILQETREHEARSHSGSPPMRYGCVRLAPTRLGQGSASSRPVFEKALSDRSLSVRLMSAVALIEIGCATPGAVAEVLRTCECIEALPVGAPAPNHTWNELPARVLMAIGGDKPEVVPTLLEGARKYSPAVGASVRKALDGMEKGAVPALVEAYPKADAKTRDFIAALIARHDPAALRGLGSDYKKLVNGWIKELSAHDYAYRWNAVMNLRDVRDASPSVITALAGALKDEHWTVRGEAAGALGTLGKPAAGTVDVLQAAAQDENEIVREIAKQAMERIQTAKK